MKLKLNIPMADVQHIEKQYQFYELSSICVNDGELNIKERSVETLPPPKMISFT